MLNVHISSKQP